MPAKVMIATPTVDRKVYVKYTLSIIALLKAEAELGVTFSTPYFTEGALLSHARNALASLMLETPSYTHILFVDSDMGFRPSAVRRLLEFDQPFVASAYPMRKFNLERMAELASQGRSYRDALSASSDYVGGHAVITTPHPETGAPSFPLKGGFAKTAKVGMGLTLIRRDVFERMEAAYPDLCVPPNQTYRDLGVRTKVFQGFTSNMQEEGTYVSEDVAFCMRWCEGCGGEIWMDVTEQLDHVGPWEFSGRMIDQLRAWSVTQENALAVRGKLGSGGGAPGLARGVPWGDARRVLDPARPHPAAPGSPCGRAGGGSHHAWAGSMALPVRRDRRAVWG